MMLIISSNKSTEIEKNINVEDGWIQGCILFR